MTGIRLGLTLLLCMATSAGADAPEPIRFSGVKGGLVVHLGCGDGRLTAALRANDSYIVHGLDTDAEHVAKTRQHVKSLQLCGKVTADTFDGRHLPYTDDLVSLLVVSKAYDVAEEEMLRVLRPGGVACISSNGDWERTVKPWPKDIDEWTHYLHGPDNNAVAHDTVVGPPRHMQWLGEPRWCRNHHRLCSISSVVTAKGRLFYIADDATAANMGVPGRWSIVARDAFSGVRLWKKPVQSWAWHNLRFRSGPPQVTRLLVAGGERLYAPLGLSKPISAMDAATGRTLRTYENTDDAEEIILAGATLLVLKGTPAAEHAEKHPDFKGRSGLPNRKTLVALNAETGNTMWTWSAPQTNPMPETLTSDGKRVYLQVDEAVTSLDLGSGKQVWTFGERGKARRDKKLAFGKYTLVVADGVVLCKLSGKLTALSSEDGRLLWQCEAGAGFHSPLDVFVINGLVWQGFHVSDSVAPPPVRDFSEARDLHTGEIKSTNSILVDLQTAGHHHRCYREKATDRFIITGKRGIEMMDLAGDDHSRNNWVRGTCQYGMLPANGLVYAPPHACGCYMESKLWGFWALASERTVVSDQSRRVPGKARLERGPAYGAAPAGNGQSAGSWPLYRHDALRSGVARTVLPENLTRAWKASIGGRLSQPVVAGGKVLVSAVDEGAVYALDARSGKLLWRYAVGGRVDSPPAIDGGLALFGSADGSIYCLRLDDGKLAWRFMAAPADLKAVAFDQVESLWPVHGSVLVLDGVAYCCAGRSTWLDGGMHLYGLEPASGRVVCSYSYESKHPVFQEGKQNAKEEHVTRVAQNTTDYKTFLASDLSDSFSMAGGAISDVLVSDGRSVFLHHVEFSTKLEKRTRASRHLFSTSSLLDDAENHRSHWVLGTGDFSRVPVAYSWIANRPGRWNPTIAVPTAVLMVFDDHSVWGVQRKGDANGRYHLFRKQNAPFSEGEKPLPDFRRIPKGEVNKCVWKREISVRTRAMLKSGDRLWLGVTPIKITADDPHAAYEGRMGGLIQAVSAEDGSRIAEYRLDSPVVWDGMAAADSALFISTRSGEVQCWRGE